MKLLTITIPCYNSEKYMHKCIESLLPGGEDVEILIVDDGSTDGTAAIADEYALKYPSIIRVIHKENGGHGSAVNTGIENATGLYFKVVDSDDWVSDTAYREILDKLTELTGGEEVLDAVDLSMKQRRVALVVGGDSERLKILGTGEDRGAEELRAGRDALPGERDDGGLHNGEKSGEQLDDLGLARHDGFGVNKSFLSSGQSKVSTLRVRGIERSL